VAVLVEAMTAADWPAVSDIYREGIATGNATFAVEPPASWEEWCRGKIDSCSLVAREGERVVGWAALSPVSGRDCYTGVAEVSVYVLQEAQGRGIGFLLLGELVRRSEAEGIWTLQGTIFPENQVSLRLHYRHGFRKVGIRRRLGRMECGPYQGWRDVVLVERRSKVVGT